MQLLQLPVRQSLWHARAATSDASLSTGGTKHTAGLQAPHSQTCPSGHGLLHPIQETQPYAQSTTPGLSTGRTIPQSHQALREGLQAASLPQLVLRG